MDIQRERLITKVLEQPLEELFRQLDTNEGQVVFIYINKVVDKIIKDRFDRDMAKLNNKETTNG
jgi:hypothetical protein